MTTEQRTAFTEHGHVHLKGFLSKAHVRPSAEHVRVELARLGIHHRGTTLRSSVSGLPPFQQIARLSASIKLDGPGRLVPPQLFNTITTLAGSRVVAGPLQLLISLPEQGTWSLRGLNWHVDIAAPHPQRSPGVQAFILLEDVRPQGGGTLALAGSHRLVASAADRIRKLLKGPGDPLPALRDEGLSIVEMSGQAGDVHLMDMRLLHTPSINASKHLRSMATIRYHTM